MSDFINTLSPFNLILNIAGLLYREKAVSLYNENGQELLTSASIVSCSVNDTSKLMEHPIESGAVVSDYKIFNPVTATLTVALSQMEYSSEFAEVYSIYKSCKFVTLQTKTNVYQNLQILSLQHEANSQNVNRPSLVIQFKEALTVEAQFDSVKTLKNAGSGNTKNLGSKQAVESPKNSILKDIFNWVKK